MHAPVPHPLEAQRLASLEACCVLDSPRELSFDLLAYVAADVANTDIALVSIVDADRQWFKARIGLDVAQTERSISLCGHTILSPDPLIVEDAVQDERFHDNPLVTGDPKIRFYAGYPICSREGLPIGSLCVIHTEPMKLSPRQQTILSRLAQQVELAVEVRRRILETEHLLELERDEHRMRELLCQALIHDMKSPMMVVTLAAEALQSKTRDQDRVARFTSEILVASDTLARMVFDALDLVHGASPRLNLRLESCDLSQLIERVHQAFAGIFEARGIKLVVSCPPSLQALVDPELVRRVLHNLLDNAYKYGQCSRQIEVGVAAQGSSVRIWVEDEGPGIPEELRKTVFDLYARLDPESQDEGRAGYGIGLAFCQLAVKAHGGEIEAREGKNGQGCRFEVTLPRGLGDQRGLPAVASVYERRG